MVLSKLALQLAFVAGVTADTPHVHPSGTGGTWDPMGQGSVFLRMFKSEQDCKDAMHVQGANDPTKAVQRKAEGAWHGPGDGAQCMSDDHSLHDDGGANHDHGDPPKDLRAHVTCASSGNSVFVEIYEDRRPGDKQAMCGKRTNGGERLPVDIYFQVVRSSDDKCWHYSKGSGADKVEKWFSIKGCDDYGARNSLLNHILSSWGGGFHHHH